MPPRLAISVDATISALAQGLRSILGDRLVGVYLGGSATMDDFCDASSDLDFLVVTAGPLSLEDDVALVQLHDELRAVFPMAARLEGDYAPLDRLCAIGTTVPVPGCEAGRFLPRVGEIMLSADGVYNMREQGIVVYGPDPRSVLPQVSHHHVRDAVRAMVREGIGSCETPEERADALLRLLRSAASLEAGIPTTKSAGAQWGLSHLVNRWHPAVHAALAVRSRTHTLADDQLVTESLPELERLVRALC